jgi:cytochrome P450
LNAFVKESLRITSSVAGIFPREAIRDTKIGHIKIKKGDLVLNEIYLVN